MAEKYHVHFRSADESEPSTKPSNHSRTSFYICSLLLKMHLFPCFSLLWKQCLRKKVDQCELLLHPHVVFYMCPRHCNAEAKGAFRSTTKDRILSRVIGWLSFQKLASQKEISRAQRPSTASGQNSLCCLTHRWLLAWVECLQLLLYAVWAKERHSLKTPMGRRPLSLACIL